MARAGFDLRAVRGKRHHAAGVIFSEFRREDLHVACEGPDGRRLGDHGRNVPRRWAVVAVENLVHSILFAKI